MSFSTQLKEKTWDIHERVEQAALNKQLFAPDLDLETYADILHHFEQVFAPLEKALAPFAACEEIGYRNRDPLLKKDLEHFGTQSPESTLSIRLPKITTAAQAVGVAYVLEGSNMGAAFIRKRLLDVLGKSTFEEGGLEFFSQTQSGKDWQAFKSRMDAFFETQADHDHQDALQAARDTFLAFEDAFTQFEHSSTK